MRRILKLGISIVVALLCGCTAKPMPSQPAPPGGKVIDTKQFVEPADLAAEKRTLPPNVRAVIVPHHAIALKLAAQALGGLEDNQIKTVVVLGPNHTADGPLIATTNAAFLTYDGILQPNKSAVYALQNKRLAQRSDVLFQTEHSIGAVMPVISHCLGSAVEVVPVVFQKAAPLGTAKQLIKIMQSADTLLVASIDFSHNLSSAEEPARRAKILRDIENMDASAVMGLDETYIDAPVVLAALLEVMREQGCRVEVLASTNSAQLLGKPVQDTTGYITAVFCEPTD